MKKFLEDQAEAEKRSVNNLVFVIFSKYQEDTEASTRTLVH